MVNDLAENLRQLCSYKKSISVVCRELGINRQQFNKYLGGKTVPSSSNLRKICDYFGVEQHELLMPGDEFKNIIRARPVVDVGMNVGSRPEIDCLDKLIERAKNEDLTKYEGSYYIYYYSTSYAKKILKCYGVVYKEEGRHFFKWIERLSLKKDSRHNGFIYKVKGLMLGISNRIFITGYEQVLQNEVIHLTLFPTFKNKVSNLAGLMLGVSGADSREPVCQRVVLSYLGKHANHRDALEQCGVFDEDSDDVSEEIKQAIRNVIESDESVFLGRPL